MRQVYFDHSATTPVRSEVFEAMRPYFSQNFGNASSIHSCGQKARKALENARKSVATLLDAKKNEIYFTSGGTESDNLALQGVAGALRKKGRHIITSAIEHPAVLNTCRYLEKQGFKVDYVSVDENGLVNPLTIQAALKPQTVLVSIMMANNEVGTIQPVHEISKITNARGVALHTDAVQATGKISVSVEDLKVDLLTISGHKINGPKGIGVLYIRKDTPFAPLFYGGHHEHGVRPGTENVAAAVGMAKAMELAEEERDVFYEKMLRLREMLEKSIRDRISNVKLNGHQKKRLPTISNISFLSVDGETLQLVLDSKNIAVSTGAACSSGSAEVSHVLTAMGLSAQDAAASLRFSLGLLNSEDDIHYLLDILSTVISTLR